MFGQRTENILVIKTDSLSGFVAAEPMFDAIRERHAKAKISLLTLPALQRIARASPYFDQVAPLPDFRNAVEKRVFAKQLKSAKFSRVYDLSANDAARKVQAAVGPFGPKWLSAAPPQRRGRKDDPAVVLPRFDKLHAAAGLAAPARLPDFGWALAARKDSANMRPAWFGVSGAFGLLIPCADETRRWPARLYGEFARMVARIGVMPVLLGGKELHGFGDEVCEHAPEVVDLTGKTDHLQLAALAREACFFVSDAAEEVQLVVSVGCAGVLIKRAAEAAHAPEGRNVMTLTVRQSMDEAEPEHVWRALNNMGLIPGESLQTAAGAR